MCLIDLPLADDHGRNCIVQAEIVDVAPHLASIATFAVHSNALDADLGAWRVSNVETGYSVSAADHYSKDGCLESARKFLSGVTLERMKKLMPAESA